MKRSRQFGFSPNKKLDTSVIPRGYYCYDENGLCPYWSIRKNKPEQQNGYCKYLRLGDWQNKRGIGILWDQCKECDVNWLPRSRTLQRLEIEIATETIVKKWS